MVSPIKNSPASTASAASNAARKPSADAKTKTAAPYTRNAAPASIASPHVAGAPGKLGQARVNLTGDRRVPTHLLFSGSDNEVGVMYKVKRNAVGDPKAQVAPSEVPAEDPAILETSDPSMTTAQFKPEA